MSRALVRGANPLAFPLLRLAAGATINHGLASEAGRDFASAADGLIVRADPRDFRVAAKRQRRRIIERRAHPLATRLRGCRASRSNRRCRAATAGRICTVWS